MTLTEKTKELKEIIVTSLKPIINNDYILCDLPYHANIGDTLIWEGELSFLHSLPFKCLNATSNTTFAYPKLEKSTLILFHGGGNFGDLYPEHLSFLKNLISEYPENRVIVFPQTIYYSNRNNLIIDSKFFKKCKNLTICARDNSSFVLSKSYFSDATLLVPDLAFYIEPSQLLRLNKNLEFSEVIFMKRKDNEFRSFDNTKIPSESHERDWPTFDKSLNDGIFIAKIISNLSKLNLPLIGSRINKLWDNYAHKVYRCDLINIGVNFLGKYQTIYSTRLHGCILGILLNKRVFFIDNSYGKNLGFYNTWLSNCDNVTLLKS